MNSWLYSLVAVSLISLISMVGVFTLAISRKVLEKIILFLVAFAAGGLLGDVFIHLIPNLGQESGFSLFVSGLILAGFLVFFAFEKFLNWRHCHEVDCRKHQQNLGTMNLVADGLHNFIDGAMIAASFLVSPAVGIATSLAVILHEIPQEIGDFAVLIHSGFTRRKALFYNLLSALTAFLGAILVLFTQQTGKISQFLLPLTAGSFLYIAAADLIPQLHQERELKRSAFQFIGLLLGMAVMVLLLLLE